MGAVSSVVDAVGDIGEGVIDAVSDVGSAVDDAVNDVIPGGWATVASVAVPGAAPYIVAANTLDKGGSLEDALTNAAISYGIGQVAQNIGAPEAGSLDAGPGAYDVSEYLTPEMTAQMADGIANIPPSTSLDVTDYSTAIPMDVQDPMGYTPPSTGIETLTPIPPIEAAPSGIEALPPVADDGLTQGILDAGAVPPEPVMPSAPPVPPVAPDRVTDAGGLQMTTQDPQGYIPPSPGIFQSIADATGLPLGLVSTLGTTLGISALGSALSPDQPQQPQATPQTPVGVGLSPDYQPYRYQPYAQGGIAGLSPMASGGISNLGGYSDGGRLLKGPGDGVSDSIPATIGGKQPARLADGEFVVPARIVSELGNGSTDAGARKLYEMMDRIQSARRKTMGKKQFAKDTKADKFLPT